MKNPFDPGYYFSEQLRTFGFRRVGENSFIARNCTIIGVENIEVGDNVRIDGFTSIIAPHGSVKIGSFVHIATACFIGGRAGVEIGDYSSLSQGVRLFSAIDDYSGRCMTNSALPPHVLRVEAAPIRIEAHVPIGSGTLVLPGVTIHEGAAVGPLSIVLQSLEGWRIYAGNPTKPVKARSRDLLSLVDKIDAGPDQ